jgi:polyhydroxyalkanoate synthesis regulator phasin
MNNPLRRIIRYRNRKLYEASERRFVTIHDLARTVSAGGRVQVIAADTREDITAKILSRALASEKTHVAATTDTLARIFQAGSEAAQTVAGVVEKVGGVSVAERMRRAARPERLAETFAPLTRRFEDARQDVEQIVGGLVERGRLTWEEGTRLRDDVGNVFRDSLADVIGRVRDLATRLGTNASPELAAEIADLKVRLAQLENLAHRSFPVRARKPSNVIAVLAAKNKRRAGTAPPVRKRRTS